MRISCYQRVVSVIGIAILVVFSISSLSVASDILAGGDYIFAGARYDAETDKLFREAMEKREAGDVHGAIRDFRTILDSHPGLHRVRLELAVAYHRVFRHEEAVGEAEEVLKDPTIPPLVKVSILAFLSQVKADAQVAVDRHHWRFPVEFGFVYDTNVNAGPSAHVLKTAGRLEEGYAEESDSGLMMDMGIEHTYQTGKLFNIAGNTASLLWQSGVYAYYRPYFSEHDNNFGVFTIRTGPTLVTVRPWRANIIFQYDYISYGDDDLAHYFHLLPTFTIHVTDALELTTDLHLSRRDFVRSEYEGRDSIYGLGRVSARYTFRGGDLALRGGLEIFGENAEDEQYTNFGQAFFVGGNWRFWERFNLFTRARGQLIDYDAPPPGFTHARDETEWRLTAGINHTFEGLGFLTDWKAEAKVVYTDLNSNIGIYEYDRTETLITFSRAF